MRRFRYLLLCLAAIVLGVVSPFIVNLGPDYSDPAARQGLFYAWFYLLPTAADRLLWPQGEVLMLALAIAMFTLQYLVVFGLAAASLAVAKFLHDFIAPPKHRRELLRRRA